jgi:hypothetical protein
MLSINIGSYRYPHSRGYGRSTWRQDARDQADCQGVCTSSHTEAGLLQTCVRQPPGMHGRTSYQLLHSIFHEVRSMTYLSHVSINLALIKYYVYLFGSSRRKHTLNATCFSETFHFVRRPTSLLLSRKVLSHEDIWQTKFSRDRFPCNRSVAM